MQRVDSRRLPGPSLLWDRPGAVIDVRFDYGENPDAAIAAWKRQLRRLLAATGWDGEHTASHRYPYGASLAVSAPIDALYAATELNDWAYEAACRYLADGEDPPLGPNTVDRFRQLIAAERRPSLLALQAAAADHGLPFLHDTSTVSIGHGHRSESWPLRRLPDPDEVPWDTLGRIPLALVTGTNGKTTSVRLLASMARQGGLCTGISSTDGLWVDDSQVEPGDYSGPEGARRILRDRHVELAVLETARGGLQRRGLGTSDADAVLITNIAADHLGDFGVHDLASLADVKWVATRALHGSGELVLNADDPLLVERSASADAPLVWFSPDAGNTVLQRHIAAGGSAATVEDDALVLIRNGERDPLLPVAEVPLTFGGLARHNVANALGAAALATALGLSRKAILAGLRSTRDADNPGRCNTYRIDGMTVLVDFAHNAHGMQALIDLATALPAGRRLITVGQAGDRPDADIREMVRVVARAGLDRIVVKRMNEHRRGRRRDEVPELIVDELRRNDVSDDRIVLTDNDVDATHDALEWGRPGDLLVLILLASKDRIMHELRRREERSGR